MIFFVVVEAEGGAGCCAWGGGQGRGKAEGALQKERGKARRV